MDNPREDRRPAKVRVDFRPNRAKPARVKDWKRLITADAGDIDAPPTESVVTKGDLSRKRTLCQGDPADSQLRSGVVVAIRGLIADVDDGQYLWPCTVRRVLRTLRIGERHPIAVGDRVRFYSQADVEGVSREGTIDQVEPRRSALKRRVGRTDQTIATNVDQAIIVASCGIPALNTHLIDRYLVAVLSGAMEPVICINKSDLAEEDELAAAGALYRPLGYRVLSTSVVTGQGLDELGEIMRGRTTVMTGKSGVGKSSLLNAVQPGLRLRVGAVIEGTGKGRHTTTTASLLRLPGGGYVVDTPGVKSFDVAGLAAGEVEAHFVEIARRVPDCRFPDCSHRHEPDCAVRAAVESGGIDSGRYESYVRLFEERCGDSPPPPR